MEDNTQVQVQEPTKIDNPKKRLFINTYRQTFGHITNTCAAVEIHRSTYYKWLEEDATFRQEIIDAELELNDDIREVLIQKAAEGDMTAVIFYLKKRHPDFKEQPLVLQQFNADKLEVQWSDGTKIK